LNEKKEEKEKEVKKEEKKPKTNLVQERLKMMMLNNAKKQAEDKKPVEKDTTKKDDKKKPEASKNAFAERIKNMEAANNDKKQEKKEEPKKLNNNFLNKLKQFQEQPKKEEKPKPKPQEKPKEKPKENPKEQPKNQTSENPQGKPTFRNAIMERLNKRNSQDTTKKNEPPKNNVLNKFGGAFALKLAQMGMVGNQGPPGMRHRFSAMIPSSKMGFGKKTESSTQDNNNANNLGIINEEPDKLKEGYDPATNLQKTLDSVVIQKNKKKMKKPTDF